MLRLFRMPDRFLLAFTLLAVHFRAALLLDSGLVFALTMQKVALLVDGDLDKIDQPTDLARVYAAERKDFFLDHRHQGAQRLRHVQQRLAILEIECLRHLRPCIDELLRLDLHEVDDQ